MDEKAYKHFKSEEEYLSERLRLITKNLRIAKKAFKERNRHDFLTYCDFIKNSATFCVWTTSELTTDEQWNEARKYEVQNGIN